jgi:lactate racemase
LEFWIPYGETEVPIRVPDDNFYKILEPARITPKDYAALTERALDSPVGDSSISRFAHGSRAGIVVDPLVPADVVQKTVETLRSRMSPLGIETITIFLRRRTSNLPTIQGLPETVLVDPSGGPFADIGRTSSGTPVQVREDFQSCQVKICLNMVTPHFLSGFTGGPDAILPGVCSRESIARNRSLALKGQLSSQDVFSGHVLADTLEACRLVGPIFSVSFIPDGSGGIDSVFSGELEPTFKEATARYQQVHRPKIDVKPDIVVLPAGSVLGMDLYHSVRVLPNAWDVVRKDGTLILAAECSKGIGDESFLEFSRRFEDRKVLSNELRHHFKLGAHVALLLKEAVERNRVQLVSVLPDHYIRMFNLKSARTASAAVQSSIRAEGKDAKVLIITRADLTLPVFQTT